MTISIRVFQPTDEAEIAALFAEFNDFFIDFDSFKRNIRMPGAGATLTRQMIARRLSEMG